MFKHFVFSHHFSSDEYKKFKPYYIAVIFSVGFKFKKMEDYQSFYKKMKALNYKLFI